ncbi:hypothetical protein SNE510_60070 [Streptomyces sp. NE5-10]|nr:hypothetical protein SNE510_60070 [Streptomyces sp. NE5-10]
MFNRGEGHQAFSEKDVTALASSISDYAGTPVPAPESGPPETRRDAVNTREFRSTAFLSLSVPDSGTRLGAGRDRQRPATGSRTLRPDRRTRFPKDGRHL